MTTKTYFCLVKCQGFIFVFPQNAGEKMRNTKKLELLSFRYITGKVYIVFIIRRQNANKKEKKKINSIS